MKAQIMRSSVKRVLSLVLALVLLLAVTPAARAASGSGMTVAADSDEITISVSALGGSGTAELHRVAANAYISGDSLSGKSTELVSGGTVVGTYTCGSAQEYVISRYDENGGDNLFDKYYLVQDGVILAGPVYATEIASKRSVAAFDTHTKKGLTLEDATSIEAAKQMDVGNTVINMNLSELIVAAEDENGNPRDLSSRADLIEFTSNGKTFYFNKHYLGHLDGMISDYSKAGMNVTLVMISWVSTLSEDYPASLKYFDQTTRQTLAFNTANERGMEYWIAAMEFLADRYSKSAETGLVDKFVIGNEIDYAYDWYLLEPMVTDANGYFNDPVDVDVFMEEYARTLRLAELCVKKYNSQAKVCVSLTHNWAESCFEAYNANKKSVRYNSYAPKEMIDWLVENEGARGNYNWGLAVHPYPVGTTPSNPVKTDVDGTYGKKITGNPDTTPWITVSNLELYQLYLQRPENTFRGETRTVSLTETCICSVAATEANYEVSTYEQAASIAQTYYRAANIPCIDQIAYFQLHDQTTTPYKLGLMTADGVEKPAYEVWKYIDTADSFAYADPYLKYISDKASYEDVMETVSSDFDWSKMWDLGNIITDTFTVTFKDHDGTVLGTGNYGYGDAVTAPQAPAREGYVFTGWDKQVTVCNGDAVYTAVYAAETVGVTRVFGGTRYDTAFEAADLLKQKLSVEKFRNVVVACGTDFADALSGSYLANQKQAPVLLVRSRNKEINQVKEYIKANLAEGGTVYLLGGVNAVPKAMETGLEGFEVKRLAGNTRYDTNLEILKEAGVGDKDVLVCTGKDFADGLSASAVNKPILLVKDSLNAAQKGFLGTLEGNRIYIIGGTNAVNTRIENALKTYGETSRIEGATRYYTSVNIAKIFFPNAKTAVLAYGQNFPDGLSGGSLACSMDAPLILTANGKQAPAVNYAAGAGIKAGAVLGGTGLISDAVVNKIFQIS